jgi:hypothetical protein
MKASEPKSDTEPELRHREGYYLQMPAGHRPRSNIVFSAVMALLIMLGAILFMVFFLLDH